MNYKLLKATRLKIKNYLKKYYKNNLKHETHYS